MIWFYFFCLVLAAVGITLVHCENTKIRAVNAELVRELAARVAELDVLRGIVAGTTELELDMEGGDAGQH